MTDPKNPHAVELGRLGGQAKSEAKTAAVRANARRPRPRRTPRRKPDPLLDSLHAMAWAEARYQTVLATTTRRDSTAVRAYWWVNGTLPF